MGKEDKTLADRRAEAGAPLNDDEPDFAGEHTPSQTDPPNAEADAPGGEDDGYQNPTRV
jgi:hypothetical protein